MAGKYHRIYLREHLQQAFVAMQKDTELAANAYIVEAVSEALIADGYMERPQRMKTGEELLAEKEAEEAASASRLSSGGKAPLRRRRRRAS